MVLDLSAICLSLFCVFVGIFCFDKHSKRTDTAQVCFHNKFHGVTLVGKAWEWNFSALSRALLG